VYVYQGEELGLADVDLPDEVRQDPVFFRTNGEQKGRDAARVPIPWSGDTVPYGFGANERTWLPMPADWAALTIDAQQADPDSTLHQYRRMLHLRHEHPGLQGDALAVPERADGLLVVERGAGLVCVVNCSEVAAVAPVQGDVLVASDPSAMAEGGRITLPPSTGAWIQT
jgi:alpha-glucosidase